MTVDYLSLLLAPEGSPAKAPARVPTELVDQYMLDAIDEGLHVLDRKLSKDGFPVLQVAGEIYWDGPEGRRDFKRAMDTLHKKNPQVVASVKKAVGTGDWMFTLDRRTA